MAEKNEHDIWHVTKETKILIEVILVFPLVTYGDESGTMRRKDRKKF